MFAEVYELDIDEDVNRVLFALPTPMQHPDKQEQQAQQQHNKGKKQKKQSGKAAKRTPAAAVKIDGSAAGVKLLKPRLSLVVQRHLPQGMRDLEAMLDSLSLL